jgi:hypothetical protein
MKILFVVSLTAFFVMVGVIASIWRAPLPLH